MAATKATYPSIITCLTAAMTSILIIMITVTRSTTMTHLWFTRQSIIMTAGRRLRIITNLSWHTSLKLNSPTAIAKLSVIGAATMSCIRTKKTSNRMKTRIRTPSGRRTKGTTTDTIDNPMWKSATTMNMTHRESVTTCSRERTKSVSLRSTGKIRGHSMAADMTRESSRLRRSLLKSLRRPT